MCVIFIASKVRPTPEMVGKGYFQNDHGAGIAWRDKDKEGKLIVRWKKGLDEEELQELVKTLPLPFVAHMRIASVGGRLPALTHPFPITKTVDLALEGTTHGYVLFHNGHWGQWKDFSKETALKMGAKIPLGHWSDSRAIAWAAYNYGLGMLEWIDEKAVAFGPADLEVIRGNGWDEVDGVWCSNKQWQHVSGYKTYDHRQGGMGSFFNRGGNAHYEHEVDNYCKNNKVKDTEVKNNAGVSGGDLAKLPFPEVEVIWEAQQTQPRIEWRLSKKQYKRLKRKHEQALTKASGGRKKRQQAAAPRAGQHVVLDAALR